MGNKYMDTQLMDKALKFAIDAHSNTERRGKGTPYVIHVLEAVAVVETLTKDQEILAAAALHDVIEDTDVTYDDILKEFGKRIADMVNAESDTMIEGQTEEESWKARKQAAIDRLAGASPDAKMVAMGDKLSNIRAIHRDYNEIGAELWNRFHNNDPKEHEWHYRGLAKSLSDLAGTAAYEEFVQHIDSVFCGACK